MAEPRKARWGRTLAWATLGLCLNAAPTLRASPTAERVSSWWWSAQMVASPGWSVIFVLLIAGPLPVTAQMRAQRS